MVNTLIYILVFLSQSQSAPDSGDSTLFFFSSRPSLPVNGRPRPRPRLRSSLWPSQSHPSAQFGLRHSSPIISSLPSWLENSLPPLPWNDLSSAVCLPSRCKLFSLWRRPWQHSCSLYSCLYLRWRCRRTISGPLPSSLSLGLYNNEFAKLSQLLLTSLRQPSPTSAC